MEGYQLIYSACKTGINHTGNGFQIYSYTKNIPEDFSSNEGIGRICKYKAPVDLPSAPTEEEVDTMFPISCTYGKCKEEKRFFSRNKYIGLDNTGHRYGNFISHAVCFSRTDNYPICGIHSPCFWNNLPEEERNQETVPDYLDSVTLESLFADEHLSVKEINNFLSDNPDRIFYLKMMINTVFDCFNTGARIILCDEAENIPLWIGGITRAFPIYIAGEITFTTYTFDPVETDCMICGVASSGTAYSVQSARDYGIFKIFDFINGYYSEALAEGSYVDAVEVGYTISPEILDDLFGYMKHSDYAIQAVGSKVLYDSYQIYKGNGKRLMPADVEEVLQYICRRANSVFAGEFISAALKYFEEETDFTADVLYLYMKYTMDLVERLGDDALYDSICILYWNKVTELVNNYENVEVRKITGLHARVLSLREDCQSRIDRAMLDPQVEEAVSFSLEEDKVPYHNVFWMQHILDFIVRRNLTLHSFAEKYDCSILRRVYCNLQIIYDPAGVIKDFAGNQLPLSLLYELYLSFFDIFSNTQIQIALHRDLYKEILKAEDNEEFLRKTILLAMNEIRDQAYFERMVSAFEETVSLKKEEDLSILENCLDTLEKAGYPYRNTKTYAVWILKGKVFASGQKGDMGALQECDLSVLNESDKAYVVKKAFEVWGAGLTKKAAHRKLLDSLDSLGEELWPYYGAYVINLTEKHPEVFASYFSYLNQEKDRSPGSGKACEAVRDMLVSLPDRQVAGIRTASAPYITKSLRKEYEVFMNHVAEMKKGNKNGILHRLKGIFTRKGNE